ncbi:secretion protein HlyD, partial [Klebsiella pneumoniae]|nr:secretion protein HlyD [Klebsiella pneumoniae]
MNKSDAILPLAQDADPVSDMVDNERDEAELVKSRRLILLLALLMVVTGVWAWFATLDE